MMVRVALVGLMLLFAMGFRREWFIVNEDQTTKAASG